MTKSTIAILLAAYNGKAYLKEQIDSILNQEDVAVTIFMSIDTSSDGTREWVESSYGGFSQIIILEDVGRFGGAAKNFFRLIRDVDFAPYEFIAFADQDDIWYPRKLVRAVTKLKEMNADGYSSNVTAFWENGVEKLVSKAQPQCQHDYLFEAAGPGCTYVMTHSLAKKVQQCVIEHKEAMSHVWYHDWFCYAFARANGYTWIIDEKPSMRYRQHSDNEVGANHGWKAFVHRLKKVLYGRALEQAREIAFLVGMKESPFVKEWQTLTRWSLIKLAFHASHCRRKPKEKILFFIACLALATLGPKHCDTLHVK